MTGKQETPLTLRAYQDSPDAFSENKTRTPARQAERNKLFMIEKQETPLVFRLYQSIRFDRPIEKDKHYISPGGYDIRFQAENGEEIDIQFDFEDYEGSISDKDPHVLECVQKNPDYSVFSEIYYITEYMLRHIVSVSEWFIYTGEDDEPEIIPVEIFNVGFEIIRENPDTHETEFVDIEIDGKMIKPTWSGMDPEENQEGEADGED